MKNLLLVLMVPIALMSCTKEAEVEPSPKKNTVTQTSSPSFTTKTKKNYRIYMDGLGCAWSGGSCLDDFIVRGKMVNTLDSLYEVINSKKDEEIKMFFEKNSVVLTENMDPNHINDLIDGTLTVTESYIEQNKTHYIIFSDKINEEEKAVYPYVDEN